MAEAIIISAFPAKRFFVAMLTRDIELQDAILDLLDNCVDGALRQNQKEVPANQLKPYEGRWARIGFNSDGFYIKDNCGGIPRDLAETYAFRLGRPDKERDAEIATVGMYGIGMKRAIFKIGKSCSVSSQHGGTGFRVDISPNWMEDEDVWDLPISTQNLNFDSDGTEIKITLLHEPITHLFSPDKADFEESFKKSVSSHYSLIIEKGFKIYVNDEEIDPKSVGLMFDPATIGGKGIAPYFYQGLINGVEINLVIGLYRSLPTDEETEDEIQGKGSKETAGWTVVCNDRVVVYCDKTRLTGWGEAGVPNYHSQFIAISGMVVFRSNDAAQLPVTTTKRGIDGNSDTYLTVKDIMRDGLKHFTSFTNKWKSPSPERDALQAASRAVEALKISSSIPETSWTAVRKDYGGRRFVPDLPSPTIENPEKQIRFSKRISDIQLVARYLFDDETMPPGEVGGACFDSVLKKAKQ
jgi:hypothetical protein